MFNLAEVVDFWKRMNTFCQKTKKMFFLLQKDEKIHFKNQDVKDIFIILINICNKNKLKKLRTCLKLTRDITKK